MPKIPIGCRLAETVYDPGVRLDSGLPAIIAEEGKILTIEIYNKMREAGLETVSIDLR